jgi:hypothetical protein
MTTDRMCVAFSVSALLISAQLCIAAETRREAAEVWWSMWGEKVKAELNGLPEAGRRAFRDALLACSLYADEYNSGAHRAECQRAEKSFVIDFSRESSAIDLSFKNSMLNTSIMSANLALARQQGKSEMEIMDMMRGGDTRYVGLDVLERAYRQTRDSGRLSR